MIGFLFIVFGSFVAALNLACMFPDPAYAASWGKVFFATHKEKKYGNA